MGISLVEKMSLNQEDAIKAEIYKAAGREIKLRFPWLVDLMESWDPCT